jgi:predicted permease
MLLEAIVQDIRYAARSLHRTPAFTAAAVLTLTLGISATTAMSSIVRSVLLRPLPYVDADRLVRLSEWNPGGTPLFGGDNYFSNVTYDAWNGRSRTLGPIAVYSSGVFTVGGDEPVRVAGGRLSPAVFMVLGVSPAAGRFFNDDDTRQGAVPVVVLSYALWRERFGGDATALGRTIDVDDQPYVVVGIASPGFAFPDRESRLWMPTSFVPPAAGVRVMDAIARLSPGATAAQASQEGTAIARAQARPAELNVILGKGSPVEEQAIRLVDEMTSAVRPTLLFLLAGAGCLLLIACANVANLLLSRSVSRSREVAVRAALGASRSRLLRQFLTESLVVASIGGSLGALAAAMIVRAMPAIAPSDFPRVDAIWFDWHAALFAGLIALATGVIAGAVPAASGARLVLLPGLRDGRGAAEGSLATAARRLILGTEASLAVMLLAVAMLAGRSLLALLHVDPGYDAANIVTARIYLPGAARGQAQTDTFIPALLERVRALPGVVAAGAGAMAPFGVTTMATPLTIAIPARQPVTAPSLVYVVTPGYAEALRLRLRAGRLLSDADMRSASQSVVVNDDFVRTFLGGRDPIGVNVGVILTRGVTAEIVGVVRNVLKDGLDTASQPEVYIVPAHRYAMRHEINLIVRTTGSPMSVGASVRSLVHDLRAGAAVENVATLESQVSASVGNRRFAAATAAGFATLALILAGVGVYGVLSYGVSMRTREIGVRVALGASRRRIMTLVTRDGMSVVGLGLAAGLAGAAVVSRLMSHLLFGIEPLDPVAFLLAPCLLAAVALVACALPARRAARIDPAQALRAD